MVSNGQKVRRIYVAFYGDEQGQTTIPGEIRKALQIKPGDKLEYMVKGDHATIRVHPGTRSLKGVLDSKKGNGFCPNPGGRRESCP